MVENGLKPSRKFEEIETDEFEFASFYFFFKSEYVFLEKLTLTV